MSKKIGVVSSILAVIALAVAVAALVFALRPAPAASAADGDTQYVMYLGTNDKDTNQPVFPPEEAKAQAEQILLKHFGGYTIQDANGGWVDGGTTYREYTLVLYLSDTTIDDVHAAADEMLDVFRQSSVLIQSNKTETDFYSGSNG
ncbi:MAG: DUF3574 domain-containing protein [Clostridia bacterium]|nr:DUF3574 domain-containing protein [Clostridia bacterium]